jgi:hypothetical protein
VELDSRARAAIARRHPLVAGHAAAFVVAVAPDARAEVQRILERLVSEINEGAPGALESLIDEMVVVPDLAAPLVAAARREADFRSRMLRDFGSFSAAELAELHGGEPGGTRVANRWRVEGRVFGVPTKGTLRYLGFQFDDQGEPLPVMSEVLAVLGGWPAWQVATWFVTANPLLDRAQPVSLLRERPASVVAAARHDARAAVRGRPRSVAVGGATTPG